MSNIQKYIEVLSVRESSSTVFNFYQSRRVANNLKHYLEVMISHKGKRILLVGEAPGYKGCKITGIPFTSGEVIRTSRHPILEKVRNSIYLSKVESENTATIVWEYLEKKKSAPLFWNSFPFHPHPKGNPDRNRLPNKKEIKEGISYLASLAEIYQPDIVAGIGHSGECSAKQAFPEKRIKYIRHPSFGGKSDFIDGMNKII